MAKAQRKPSSSKRKQILVEETHISIAEQTAAFLKKGGEIDEIPRGVSGQKSIAGPKHITLGNRSNK